MVIIRAEIAVIKHTFTSYLLIPIVLNRLMPGPNQNFPSELILKKISINFKGTIFQIIYS
jgi:hypothetical protein